MTLQHYQKVIADLTPEYASVLDVGCGTGQLLQYLKTHKHVKGRGLELESSRVAEALAHGLSVVQGDGDSELVHYPDQAFDVVVLSLTLQVMKHPKDVLEQALRIGKQVMVAIPNFGQVHNRLFLLLKGRMPVTNKLSYQWYETPNIHFCTIKDMVALAEDIGCIIRHRYYLSQQGKAKPFRGDGAFNANLFGAYGIFVLEKHVNPSSN